jgi:hypothetical protein
MLLQARSRERIFSLLHVETVYVQPVIMTFPYYKLQVAVGSTGLAKKNPIAFHPSL